MSCSATRRTSRRRSATCSKGSTSRIRDSTSPPTSASTGSVLDGIPQPLARRDVPARGAYRDRQRLERRLQYARDVYVGPEMRGWRSSIASEVVTRSPPGWSRPAQRRRRGTPPRVRRRPGALAMTTPGERRWRRSRKWSASDAGAPPEWSARARATNPRPLERGWWQLALRPTERSLSAAPSQATYATPSLTRYRARESAPATRECPNDTLDVRPEVVTRSV